MRRKTSRRKSAKTRVLEHELEAARKFIDTDPIGKRLQAAEHILTLLMKEELPRIKRFIFNASFDLRRVANRETLEKIVQANPRMSELNKTSKTGAHVRIHLEKDALKFVLFYEKALNASEALLFSDSFARIVASTYASLGLDMNGLQSALGLDDLKKKIKSEFP